ncbi:glycoside hydrolase family 43 protein [Paenibacillus sp. PL91]|uniref:glycoside hydrolase family 43 protein n=1 Tax=Paenibacillus sp. PL91 TaxID=2729538 RepID=UPI001658C5AE|nr:glycoside hydrolase family 43 protein [Paenibacillus sp. PL91]MBC9200137.1 glycoside hydrolase family 43 protein [Paenibacillus sp. PL91]
MFSYFKTDDESLYAAVSEDGYAWKEWNGGSPVLQGKDAGGRIRDPFVMEDETGRFHAVWTDSWEGTTIGYAWSDDLMRWKGIQSLPVMADVDGTLNCWAPEIIFDEAKGSYRIFWSSTVAQPGAGKLRDHRIWSVLTDDFERFTAPQLYFDPGYNVIDATVADLGDQYLLLFKDERGLNNSETDYKAIRSLAFGKNEEHLPEPTCVSGLITPALSEGPTLYEAVNGSGGREWIMLYDLFHFREYGAMRSSDLIHWENITHMMTFPPDRRHGSVIRVRNSTALQFHEPDSE